MRARRRWALALTALALPALAIAGTALLWREVLPERIATHWSDFGAADGDAPTIVVFVIVLGVAAAAAITGTVLVTAARLTARTTQASMFWLGMPAALAAACWLVPAWLTLRAGSAEDAVLGVWIIPLLLCILYGFVPYALAPRPGATEEPASQTMPLAPSEVGAWSRTLTANIFVYATIVVAAIAVVVILPLAISGSLASAWLAPVILLVATVVLASFIRIRVSADWRGLRVVSLLLRIPLKRVPLDRIRRAEAAQLNPGEWGGWGYRIMPGRSALVLRSGPGLVITSVDGTQFAISLADADDPARLLNTLRGQEVGADSA
ncbi:hypothetical protein [Microbacterium binotii]|uniref:hypothetical protein n=1 Tax=Microbacterium binotii TaxID=462710 RepID=UPI001F3D0455|nr:hypothetical protein [Microbacterium binotii]UIN31909.1 hypothetical protein LXM64_06900 [Microbacterium binotii]